MPVILSDNNMRLELCLQSPDFPVFQKEWVAVLIELYKNTGPRGHSLLLFSFLFWNRFSLDMLLYWIQSWADMNRKCNIFFVF